MLLATPQLLTKRGLVPYRILSIQNRLFKIRIYGNPRQGSYVLYFVINYQLNSSLDKSNLFLFIDAAVFVFKGLQIYLLSISFHKVYKLAEILTVQLYTILELFCVIILYNMRILGLTLQKGLQLQLYSNLLFIKLIKRNLVQ